MTRKTCKTDDFSRAGAQFSPRSTVARGCARTDGPSQRPAVFHLGRLAAFFCAAHGSEETAAIERGSNITGNHLAVAHHDDAVAGLKNFAEEMGDEDT